MAVMPSPSPSQSSSCFPSAAPILDGKEATRSGRGGMHPAFHIATWMFFSNLTVIFTKFIIDSAGFRYPILLTSWHLIFSSVATQVLARTTTLLDSRYKLPITPGLYLRTICPIGIFYSGSLVCSNLAYLYLSVALIQILKSASLIAVLGASWLWRVADPSVGTLVNVLVIFVGTAIASIGGTQSSLIGVLYQLGGIVFGAFHLVTVQHLLRNEGRSLSMDPLVGLYYFAPVCAAISFVVALIVELPTFDWNDLARVGTIMLLLNALVAFTLNLTSVFLIGKTSGLVMALSGILKNILLVVFSVLVWNTQITFIQALGYSIALAGLVYYSLEHNQFVNVAHAFTAWTAATLCPASSCRSVFAPGAWRLLLVGVAALAALWIVISLRLQPASFPHLIRAR